MDPQTFELIRQKLTKSLMPRGPIAPDPWAIGPMLKPEPPPSNVGGTAVLHGYDRNGQLRGDFGFQPPAVTDEQYYNAIQNRRGNQQTPI